MPPLKILLANLGYARNIDGLLRSHVRYVWHYVACPPAVQEAALAQFRAQLEIEQPDLCCLVEVDTGSSNNAQVNQMQLLVSETYPFFDVTNKYGPAFGLSSNRIAGGKSNGFLSRTPLPFTHVYMASGTKRLIYIVGLTPEITVVFGHFSLRKRIRAQQFAELAKIICDLPGEVILMGDFNTFSGFGELDPLLAATGLRLMNNPAAYTFVFSGLAMTLDLVLCTPGVADVCRLRPLHLPFSDHDAVIAEIFP
jgi:endonuclease/exonuclease/phosphatase family metal-dependent hydrolase